MRGKEVRETVGLIALVAGLVFVGLEIRQNTVAAKAAAYQEVGITLFEYWHVVSQDPVYAELRVRDWDLPCSLDPERYTRTEDIQMILSQVAGARQVETTWRLVELGLLEDEVMDWFGWEGWNYAENPLWPCARQFMSADFAAFVETRGQ